MAEAIAAISFPVYGVVGEPLGLQLYSYGGGFRGNNQLFNDLQPFEITYKSPRYPVYSMGGRNALYTLSTFRILSKNAQHHLVRAKDHYLEKIIEGQAQPVRNPFRWEGPSPSQRHPSLASSPTIPPLF
jgi:hypothetical protein